MSKYQFLYSADEVYEALVERVFADMNPFGSKDEFKTVARALAELCYSEEMTVLGKIYYQNDLRRMIIEGLEADTLFKAFEMYKHQYHSKGAKLLAWLILREHLTQDELYGLMVEYDLGRGA